MSAMRSLRLVACLESDEDSRLPAGPMLEGLECLVADVDFAARSASVLAAATRLHTLGLVNRYTGFGPEETDDDDEEDGLGVCWRAVWREALRLPPLLPALRHLALGGSSWNLRKFVQDVVDVQRSLPHLDISCLFASEGQEDAAQRRLLARCGLRLPCVQSEFNSFIA